MYIRVKQALNYLKRNDNLMQKDLAEKMGMAESSFTRAMARLKEKNDDSFVIKLQSVAPSLNLDYLLTGEGSLLLSSANEPSRFRYPSASPSMGMVSEDTPSPSVSPSPSPSEPLPLWADTMIHILSKQIADIEALHSELRHSISEVSDLKNQLSHLLETLQK
jgi:hypothetical protein